MSNRKKIDILLIKIVWKQTHVVFKNETKDMDGSQPSRTKNKIRIQGECKLISENRTELTREKMEEFFLRIIVETTS